MINAAIEASMGPRELPRGDRNRQKVAIDLFIGFNGAAGITPRRKRTARQRLRTGRASMGPRELPRGDAPVTPWASTVTVLQWGRGNYPAERVTRLAPPAAGVPLQWGRGNYPAERGGRSFFALLNAALQWGRGNYPAENCHD